MKSILVAYRPRGAVAWSHHFHVWPGQWECFYEIARASRETSEYAVIRNGDYEPLSKGSI